MGCPICDNKPANCDCTATEREQFDEIQKLQAEIARLREERRWVPVGERLPEVWTEVLFLERQEYVDEHSVVSRGIVMACLTDDHEISSNCDLHQPFHSVTHWQPLPPGPEGNR